MSDQPQVTNSVELAVRDEIIQIAGWSPETTLADIENQLGSLYGTAQQAGDQSTMDIVSATWGQVQALANQGAGLLDIAAAARESLQEAIEQNDALVDEIEEVRSERDVVQEQFDELIADLDDPYDASNGKVVRLIEEVQEAEWEYAHDAVRENIIETLMGIGLSWRQSSSICGILADGIPSLSSEDQAELFEVLNRIVPPKESKL